MKYCAIACAGVLRCATRLRSSELNHDDPSSFSPPAAFGPFRVLHQIGSGVLGPVFRTFDPEQEKLVAVKVFRLDVVPEISARLADIPTSRPPFDDNVRAPYAPLVMIESGE